MAEAAQTLDRTEAESTSRIITWHPPWIAVIQALALRAANRCNGAGTIIHFPVVPAKRKFCALLPPWLPFLIGHGTNSLDARIARLPAHIGLVYLNRPIQARRAVGRHGKANPVHQKERALIREPGLPLDLQCAYSLLARASRPERIAPMPERDAAILEHGADPHGVLIATITAGPQEPLVPLAVPALHLVHVRRAAARTRRAVAPPLALQKLDGSQLVRTRPWKLSHDLRPVLCDLAHCLSL